MSFAQLQALITRVYSSAYDVSSGERHITGSSQVSAGVQILTHSLLKCIRQLVKEGRGSECATNFCAEITRSALTISSRVVCMEDKPQWSVIDK